MNIVISSGHGKYIRGAEGILDEVDEARRVVGEVAERLTRLGVGVQTFHDNTSHNQSDNLDAIVDFHNRQTRDLDVSVHFNAYETTAGAMGVEVLYVSQSELAKNVSDAIATASGLQDRGPKKRTDLKFLNQTDEPAILIETCFVDSQADANLYNAAFHNICAAIAAALSGATEPINEWPPPTDVTIPAVKPTVTITVQGNAIEFKVDPPDSVNVIILPNTSNASSTH